MMSERDKVYSELPEFLKENYQIMFNNFKIAKNFHLDTYSQLGHKDTEDFEYKNDLITSFAILTVQILDFTSVENLNKLSEKEDFSFPDLVTVMYALFLEDASKKDLTSVTNVVEKSKVEFSSFSEELGIRYTDLNSQVSIDVDFSRRIRFSNIKQEDFKVLSNLKCSDFNYFDKESNSGYIELKETMNFFEENLEHTVFARKSFWDVEFSEKETN